MNEGATEPQHPLPDDLPDLQGTREVREHRGGSHKGSTSLKANQSSLWCSCGTCPVSHPGTYIRIYVVEIVTDHNRVINPAGLLWLTVSGYNGRV